MSFSAKRVFTHFLELAPLLVVMPQADVVRAMTPEFNPLGDHFRRPFSVIVAEYAAWTKEMLQQFKIGLAL